mmetsp:Transcript_9624/g.9724  ORF Transcript_9624/g.9724 Transcript_9624/m.9724 type:complete len:102 (-) Transcript_9624:283-588(-)
MGVLWLVNRAKFIAKRLDMYVYLPTGFRCRRNYRVLLKNVVWAAKVTNFRTGNVSNIPYRVSALSMEFVSLITVLNFVAHANNLEWFRLGKVFHNGLPNKL